MLPPAHVTDRHRSTGAVSAYKRAVSSLIAVLSFAWVLRTELWVRFVRTPPHVFVNVSPIPGFHRVGVHLIHVSEQTRRAQERFFAEAAEFQMWPHEYLIARAQFEPILAFLIVGAVVAVVARYGRPFRAWLDDLRLV